MEPSKTYSQRLYVGLLTSVNQYVFVMRFGKTKGEMGQYKTLAEFTIRDRDVFYERLVFLAIGAICAIVGAVVVLIVQAIT